MEKEELLLPNGGDEKPNRLKLLEIVINVVKTSPSLDKKLLVEATQMMRDDIARSQPGFVDHVHNLLNSMPGIESKSNTEKQVIATALFLTLDPYSWREEEAKTKRQKEMKEKAQDVRFRREWNTLKKK